MHRRKRISAALAPLVGVTGPVRSLAADGVLERVRADAAQARGFQHGPRLGAAIAVIDQVRVPPGRHEHRGGRNRVLQDRKSTRLNSSHLVISYAVFCLKKKKQRRRLITSTRHTTCLEDTR